MPKIPKRKNRKIPEGFDLIEPTIKEFERKMREVESESSDTKRAVESPWGVMRVHHQRSRYIYDLYKRKAITKEVYDYCLNEGLADRHLIEMWKKPGYENLCCLLCIRTTDTNFGGTCICRVPKSQRSEKAAFQCPNCGCRGCCGKID
ncbi:G10 protein [Rozella allomycis CSF55]|uniref:G10 protein n=1 Tax=Rozella allomycis (strain CSF55) TaxID=988480 RepID=A0A075AU47_ROZAC|nr:G10 protein domain-containing protein [Rozella allomycis CSF55]RKP16250.1 G10 protein [Rozella allomycis CSF55]|eukprot:EPZ33788.1 G10 protein domain-containing protein [Rozella allomycis CSF55]